MKRLGILLLTLALLLSGCADAPADAPQGTELPLQYAEGFRVERLENGCSRILIGEERYLVVPEGGSVSEGTEKDTVILRQPLRNIYLVGTSAMDMFVSLDALNTIALSGTDAGGWYVPEARAAMEAGKILYAGKYSAPGL